MKKLKDRQIPSDALLFIVLPFLINILLESLGSNDFLGGIRKFAVDPYIFFCNTLVVALTISPGVFLGRFRYFWAGIASFAWIALGTINWVLLTNRVLPFSPYDLRLLDVLPLVIRKYLNPTSLAVVCLGAVGFLLGIAVLFFRTLSAPKRKIHFAKSLVFFAMLGILTWSNLGYAVSSGVLKTQFSELSKDYSENGFAYSFTFGLLDSGVDKVEGYSKELMDSVTENFGKENKEAKTPNIVFVQMESFFDLNAMKKVGFSENPVPNLTELARENPSGLITVPVVGAGTVNTEFEIITGMRIADFGAGEYPYKTVLTKNTCESLANNLRNHGYVSHFIHNYKGSFYGRDKVYANLGYDNFYSLEYMTGYEENESGWAKDTVLLRYINESLDSTQGADLINAVSVQGHGSYTDKTDFEKHISVTRCDDESMQSAYEYYANQIFEMDEFLGQLVDSISARDEETVLVIYGDHFPSLKIESEDLKGRTIYQTDYIIWNNMGIDFGDEDLPAYQLNSKILSFLNIDDGVINSCHQHFKDKENYLFNLQALEYDVLYGEKYVYSGKNPYGVSDMRVNQRKMEIISVIKKKDEDGAYVVSGDGFSDKTYVRLGYTIVHTQYIDENTLVFRHRLWNEDTPVYVWEKDIGESEKYIMK